MYAWKPASFSQLYHKSFLLCYAFMILLSFKNIFISKQSLIHSHYAVSQTEVERALLMSQDRTILILNSWEMILHGTGLFFFFNGVSFFPVGRCLGTVYLTTLQHWSLDIFTFFFFFPLLSLQSTFTYFQMLLSGIKNPNIYLLYVNY